MPVFVNPRGHLSPFGEKPTIAVNTGWPEKHLLARPNDALGQAILDYRDKWQHHKDFPVEGPWDSRRGEIFLRDLDEPEAEFDEVPRYRVKPAAAFIGCVLFTQGQISSFQGYPANPSELEPENESARRVLSFMMRYLGSQKLQSAPWINGKLHFPNPAAAGSPVSPTIRWAGASAA